ncbi:hypothetical protein BC939DRAFT_447753 [Gamsiella multidivaricata]|uniref:uncharacterized protein n=1 Tax=Gamsiella multidivaricata TaxID=101098 RepID=UPI00222117A7|nr:uncharacterized protein BC939DRAFT_447753 [Gamsiella multidivaricata]KAI7826086.1 hypothetical protein BC939DRAFT_447753 [Gamsiella multidivaricata]
MRFKRPIDSKPFACLWWTAFLFVNGVLICYGVFKIIDLDSREFFIKTTRTETTREKPYQPFPDVMICTRGGVVEASLLLEFNAAATIRHYSLPSGFLGPCGQGDDTLAIVSMNNATVDCIENTSLGLSINPANTSSAVEFSRYHATVIITSGQSNPYVQPGALSQDINQPEDLYINTYTVPHNMTGIDIRVVPKSTRVIGKDFWGLFGNHESENMQSISSTATTYTEIGETNIYVFVPSYSLEDEQILVTPVLRVFSDWGGAFSAAWGVFYFFFGSSRVEPFGLITARFLRRKTKRNIAAKYGYLASDLEANKPEESSLVSTSQPLYPPEKSPGQEKEVPPTNLPYSSDIAAEKGVVDLALILEKLKQQEERIQRQEKQIQEHKKDAYKVKKDFYNMEGLLKDYYLNMDLVDAEGLVSAGQRWYDLFF